MSEFRIVEGTVLGESTTSQTHVSGSVGTGVRGDVSGSISSHTTETQNFWLTTESGKEIHVKVRTAIPLRPGHNVVMLHHITNPETGAYFLEPTYIYIRNTEETYRIWNPTTFEEKLNDLPSMLQLLVRLGIGLGTGVAGILLLISIIVLIFGSPKWQGISILFIAGIITRLLHDLRFSPYLISV